jgi:hypothetical protein
VGGGASEYLMRAPGRLFAPRTIEHGVKARAFVDFRVEKIRPAAY